MAFKLTILGCGSAVPSVDENTTAQLLNVNERFFLIDCAEGTQVQLRKYKIKFQKIANMLKDAEEFIDEFKLSSIITKYSNYIPFPIFLNVIPNLRLL